VAGLDRPGVAFSALAGDAVLVRTVEIPKVAARRAEAILRREIEDDVPLDVDEAIVDHVDAPTPGRPTVHSLVVTVTRDAVRQHLSLLEGAGLDPAEVGVGAAVYSELARVVPSLGGADPVLVVDIGSARTETAIVEGGLVVSMRAISVGGRDLTLALAEHYRCSFEKAEEYKRACGWMDMGGVLGPVLDRIVPQLRQTMGAFASRTGRKVWKVILCGGASAIDGLPELLAQSVGLPVGLLVDEMDPSQGESRTTAPFLRATALAFRALPSITEQRLDLRKGPFVFRGQVRATRRRWIRVVAAVLVIVLGWSFYSLARYSSLKARQSRQRERLAELTSQYMGEEVRDFDVAEKMMLTAKPIKSPMPKADAFDFIDEMSRIIPEEIIHDIEELEIKPGKVQIRGIVDTIAARDEIIARLEEYTECVQAISKGKTTQSPKDNRQKYTLDLETECP
jgi:type IV pilus assembly protein PilM